MKQGRTRAGRRQPSKATGRAQAGPVLLPEPQKITRRRGEFQIAPDTVLLLPSDDAGIDRRLVLAAERTRDRIESATGHRLAIGADAPTDAKRRSIRLELDPRAAIASRRPTARDAYRLTVATSGITIAAPTRRGLSYGLTALTQLVDPKGRVPCLEILDQPDFKDRGIMLDVSRGKVPKRATLEGLVDLCSDLRLNVLMLYIEHTFAFRAHPEIGAGSSPLTSETILALDDYAHDRGVELIPCFQSLGHMEHILSLERYADLAESDRRWSLSPSRPESYQFLEELYAEFLPLFRSKRFNANCDEPFDLGRGQSAERLPRHTPGRLFADHVARLAKLARAHDKELMVWADFALKHPEELGRTPDDVVWMDWWYEPDFDFDRIRKLRRRGFEVWACPGTASWNCLFPRVGASTTNIERWADAGRRHGATGLLNTDWGDFGHYNALGLSFHAYAWGAQQGWSGGASGKDADARFDRAFARTIFGQADARIGALYRRLGDVHEAGFPMANGSALQHLYFDPIDRSFFLQHAQRKALEASLRKLSRVERDIERLGFDGSAPSDTAEFADLAREEILWAAQATRFSIEKSLAAIDYNAWRADPSSLRASERKRLGRAAAAQADEQKAQLEELTRLWCARSEISEFDKTRKRIRRSISSLRNAAKRLRENRPPRPPRASELSMLNVFNEVRRAFGLAAR